MGDEGKDGTILTYLLGIIMDIVIHTLMHPAITDFSSKGPMDSKTRRKSYAVGHLTS